MDLALRVLEIAGLAAFAVSGGLLAVRKHFDLVGVLVLALLTATGGGLLRDLVLDVHPPSAFTDPAYLLVPTVVGLVTLWFHRPLERLHRAVLVFDAGGLAVFATSGALLAVEAGLATVPAALLGLTTGVGGGLIRDVVARETPAVLQAHSELYAVPAFLGALAVVVIHEQWGPRPWAVVAVTAAVFVVRLLALRYKWRAPRARSA